MIFHPYIVGGYPFGAPQHMRGHPELSIAADILYFNGTAIGRILMRRRPLKTKSKDCPNLWVRALINPGIELTDYQCRILRRLMTGMYLEGRVKAPSGKALMTLAEVRPSK